VDQVGERRKLLASKYFEAVATSFPEKTPEEVAGILYSIGD
jgi:hypothetical protein